MTAAVDHLRTRVLPPALFDRYLPDGVLGDNGWAAWGPAHDASRAQQGSGYHNTMRVDTGTDYNRLLTAAAQGNANVLALLEFDALRLELNQPQAQMAASDFPRFYRALGAATSMAYQGAAFSPIPDGRGGSTFDPQLELGGSTGFIQLANNAGLAFYANLGMANISWMMAGYLEFNKRYAQETRLSSPPQPGAGWIHQGEWQITPGPTGRARWVATDVYGLAVPVPATKAYPHFVYDPIHPDVVRLCMAHVRDFAQRHRGAKGLFLRGEVTSASFGPHMVAGFRRYMEEVLAGVASQLRSRWGLSGSITFDQIDVRGAHWNARVERDYGLFLHALAKELAVLHYVEAKRARSEGWYSILGFGPSGIERSALDSDFAATGGWLSDIDKYFGSIQKNGLALGADAARLTGKPMAFAISGPPYGYFDPPRSLPQFALWAYFRKCLRDINTNYVRLYFREILTASISHIGYVKAYFYGLLAYPPSSDAVEIGIREIKALRSTTLEFMGPFQRAAIRVDDLTLLVNPRDPLNNLVAVDNASGYFGWLMSTYLRRAQIPSAVFSDDSLARSRTLSRWHLRRSLTFVSFPNAWLEKAVEYALLMDGQALGAVVVVVPAAIESQLRAVLAAAGGSLTPVLNVSFGAETATISQIRVVARNATRAYLFAFRNARVNEPLRNYCDACAVLVAGAFPDLDRLAGAPVLRPASAQLSSAELFSNCVTDGLNSLVAVSWTERSTAAQQPLAIVVEPRWRSRFDPSIVQSFSTLFVGAGNLIGPEETRFVRVEAVLSRGVRDAILAGGMTTVIAGLDAALVTLERSGFAVSHARSLLQMAVRIAGQGQYARALAAVTTVSRMVFVRAFSSGSAVTVDAWTVWSQQPVRGPKAGPVANAEAHLVLLFNGHEAQPPVTIGPAQNGRAVLPIGLPRKRWDFASSRYRVPTVADMDRGIEAHVTDSDAGGHGFVLAVAPRR